MLEVACGAKLSEAGVSAAAVPLPLSEAVACPPAMLGEGSVNSPARLPVAVGANSIETEQLAPAASVAPQPFEEIR